MPFGLGATELIVVLVLALLVFGPKRLPDVGKTLGRGVREFKSTVGEVENVKKSVTDVGDSLKKEFDVIPKDLVTSQTKVADAPKKV
jgi:sec-independent protein translocase protein TatA